MARMIGFDKGGIAKARLVGEQNRANDAVFLTFIPSTNQIHLKLRNRTEISIPVQSIAGLREVSKAALGRLKLSRIGDAIELAEYDLNVSVRGVVRKAVFGEDLYARAGRTKSKAKAVAARVNGKRGGRPKRRAFAVA